MGRQVRIYMTEDDWPELVEALSRTGPVWYAWADTNGPEHGFGAQLEGEPALGRWLRLLASPNWAPGIKRTYWPQNDCWTIDRLNGLVIECILSGMDGRQMTPGRLWYETHVVSDSTWVVKPDAFVRWAQRVVATVRRRLPRHTAASGYLGSTASALVREDGARALRGS